MNPGGRPSGRILHSEGFEAIAAARNLLKKDIAIDAGVTPSFLADLLAHRGGASPEVAQRLADTLNVKVAALFPEAVGWIAPLPGRKQRRADA